MDDTVEKKRLDEARERQIPWKKLGPYLSEMTDLFAGQTYERSGDEMCNPGLYVDLSGWGYHVLTRWLPIR